MGMATSILALSLSVLLLAGVCGRTCTVGLRDTESAAGLETRSGSPFIGFGLLVLGFVALKKLPTRSNTALAIGDRLSEMLRRRVEGELVDAPRGIEGNLLHRCERSARQVGGKRLCLLLSAF